MQWVSWSLPQPFPSWEESTLWHIPDSERWGRTYCGVPIPLHDKEMLTVLEGLTESEEVDQCYRCLKAYTQYPPRKKRKLKI